MAPKRGNDGSEDYQTTVKKYKTNLELLEDELLQELDKRKPEPDVSFIGFEGLGLKTQNQKPQVPSEERDVLLDKFSIGQLQQNGFIDYDSLLPLPNISAVFKPGPEQSANPLHFIFQRANWKGTDDTLWMKLQPSLQIATRFLNEIAMNHFFDSMIWGPHEDIQHQPMLTAALGRHPRKFGHIDKKERKKRNLWHDYNATRLLMIEMGYRIEFEWEKAPNPCIHADTEADQTLAGLDTQIPADETCSSTVYINPIYKQALSNKHFNGLPIAKAYNFGRQEAHLRARLLLAITLAHEVCHALFNATTEFAEDESFYKEHRIAEVGFAFESILFDGAMSGIGMSTPNPNNLAGAYGLQVSRWPGAHEGDTVTDLLSNTPSPSIPSSASISTSAANTTSTTSTNSNPRAILELKPLADTKIHYHTQYLIPMRWVHQFFTDEFWNNRVPKAGLAAYHPLRWVGIRAFVPYKGELCLISPEPKQMVLPPAYDW